MSTSHAAPRRPRARRDIALLAASLLLLIQSTGLVAASKQTLSPFDCSNVAVSSKQSFDLSKIAYPIRTSNQESTPPSETRTSIDIDLCKPLEANSERDEKDQCPRGTRICITIETIKDGKAIVTQAIPVAYSGESGGSKIDAKVEWGQGLEGGEKSIELVLPGATYAGREQKAELELVCDPKADADSHPTARSYDRADGELKLRWPTKFACSSTASKPGSGGDSPSQGGGSDSDDDGSSGSKASSGWGFFNWLFFLLFSGFAVYMGVGMYNNYNNYGASGWDLVPHKDFWRESPYIARDAATHVWGTVSGNRGGGGYGGSGGRGAYEPI
ncbi:Autophagy-related protein 27 [Kalmanozyma brasiliensis GHG001]|uniref:Autophagy-related protein 27 n=1 Tax=Kalmanozyma brasiliensis (strain GHG001) TaxID=1365824 RepID=V5GFW1_KALBG|nr:Autophagy-related protein 27 [Kalmanozyma brasiliensis GHG001]EST04912.1 Autophagy-related protein 27 [Kalmanozyma brasiliensis GHG001]